MTIKQYKNLLICAFLSASAAMAGEDGLSFSGYLETYYLRDFNRPENAQRPSFTYSHNQANHAAINLALIKASVSNERVRANLGLGSGSYMRANYALEPDGLQHLYEANIGIKLSERYPLWLDVGLMPSHLGFESAIGRDNWTMTRSMMADSSPYFETGAKVSYSSEDGKWIFSGLLLTGWQRIQSPAGNSTPSVGHQLVYMPNDRITINSSSFIGNDKSDRERQMRYFHDLYVQFKLDDDWSVIAALDIGAEQQAPGSRSYNVWFSPNLVAQYRVSDQVRVAGRIEYYQDRHGVIVSTGTPNGFMTTGYSINVDYQPVTNVMLRTEIRAFNSTDPLFATDDERLRRSNLMLGTALALSF